MSFDAGGRDRNEMMTKCLMQWGRKWYPLKEWINFVESVHLYEFQLPSWSSILSSSSSASHYLRSGLCCLLGVTRYSYSLTSLMFCITQISPPAAAHPLTPANLQTPVTDCMTSDKSWQRDRDSTRHITVTAPLIGANSLSDWVWRCLQCKVWTLHCTARPSCCVLLLYAIKQVLDTNTETAEQWSHTAQSGHWAPNMRDPDETTQYIYNIYTL